MSTLADSGVLSPSSISSYDYFSAPSHAGGSALSDSHGTLSEDLASDDEIVWSMSDISSSALQHAAQLRSPATLSDDYIVLSRPISPRAVLDGLSAAVASMSIGGPSSTAPIGRDANEPKTPMPSAPKRKRSKRKVAAPVQPAATSAKTTTSIAAAKASTQPSPQQKRVISARRKAKHNAAAAQSAANSGLGERPVVDDVSEAGDHRVSTPAYRDAVQYISVLSDSASRSRSASISLKFLQALIVELGLCPSAFVPAGTTSSFYSLPSLPHSMRAAKTLLKTHVFLNVRDYLDVRERGLEALRAVMHPSRSSLMREVRNGRRVPAKKVKSIGLSVLLVTSH
ncbi:hypothetical protein OBBRIDRAFT_539723 [Obba rivulosa]|uniref:Uncharacterized protein n=1 Tax=Obba rivulosa TaxID=1052685 RepID=A0A8E2DTM6_9APHY|nr:hypothetical protein OBBRIDRAFT_539723 [Obba rivulosa]